MGDQSIKREIKPKENEVLRPSDLAYSNLQCPSPPPILNTNVSTGNNISSASINDIINSEFHQPHQHHYNHNNNNNNNNNNNINLQHQDLNSNHVSYSNLQHPTPNNISQQPIGVIPKPLKDTIPAGGALLRGRVGATAVVAAVAAATAREKKLKSASPGNQQPIHTIKPSDLRTSNLSNSSLSSNDPQSATSSSHLRSPDMHAHFYVEDTIRHGGIRSRSNSNSANNEARNLRDFNNNSSINSNEDSFHNERSNSIISITPPINNNQNNNNSQNNNNQNNNNQNTNNTNPSSNGKKEQISNLDPRLPQDDGKIHILFGVCGSIGIGKIKSIISKLKDIYGKDRLSIQLILTNSAEHLISRAELSPNVTIWRDKDEWATWKQRTDPVVHIELRRWADILIVAPLTANTLSKISLGICDNLLTNVIRAWNTQYPILLAPSMVSFAYNSVITKRHLKTIKDEMPWIEVLKPVEKVIGSYGDIGMGGMMDYNEIADKIVMKLGGYPDEEDDEDDEEEDDEDNDNIQKRNKKTNDDEEDDEDDEDEDDEDDDDDEEEDDDEDEDEDALEDDEEDDSPKIKQRQEKITKSLKKLTVAEEDKLQEEQRSNSNLV
ncbi:hypothetical protein WICMUC_003457 [Wickerhamomyces mucosus]|uniref:Flavoprotein domain-containing protein n=1 Tax=Wickerhamomyces mucosus TaxID=1378264 RepID=A0A9P8PMG0_9ASCO|nr:hypothetical protein WICMUC_003457 [Wickerhamomyces mucosus]